MPKVLAALTLGLFFLFASCQKVFAALTINNVSSNTINTADDTLIISASASGLQNSTQYLQAVFTKEGETTDYLGFTKNLSDEWYQYKSSPTPTDFSGYFYNFLPTGSTWSGQISARFDSSDTGFKGPGNYVLKLLKYVTSSSPTASNNSISILVNIPVLQTANTSTNSDTSSLKPNISFDLPGSVKLAEEFKVPVKVENFDRETDYLLKIRGGVEDGKLSKLQTKNGSSFLSDNESWDKFPTFKTNNDGKWEGDMYAQATEDKPTGKYKIQIRIRKKDGDTFVESGTREMDFQPALGEEKIDESTPAAVTTAVVSAAKTITSFPEVLAASTDAQINLGTLYASDEPKISTSEVKVAGAKTTKFLTLPNFLIFSGLGLIIGAAVYLLYVNYHKFSSGN